eukprot:492774-Amphidinium_carterae.1
MKPFACPAYSVPEQSKAAAGPPCHRSQRSSRSASPTVWNKSIPNRSTLPWPVSRSAVCTSASSREC